MQLRSKIIAVVVMLIAFGIAQVNAEDPPLTVKPGISISAHMGIAANLQFSPDSKKLYSTGDDGVFRVWDVENGKKVSEVQVGWAGGGQFAVTPDGKKMVTQLEEKTKSKPIFESAKLDKNARPPDKYPLQFVDLAGKSKQVVIDGQLRRDVFTPLFFSEDGSRLMCKKADYGPPVVWDFKYGKSYQPDLEKAGYGDSSYRKVQVFRPALSADGKLLAFLVRYGDRELKDDRVIWDIDAGMKKSLIQPHPTQMYRQIVFHPDGKSLVLVDLVLNVASYDVATGKMIRNFARKPDPRKPRVTATQESNCWVSFDSKGENLLIVTRFAKPDAPDPSQGTPLPGKSTDIPPEARLWKYSTGVELMKVELPTDTYHAILSPDGKKIAIGCGTKTTDPDVVKNPAKLPVAKWTGLIKFLLIEK